jgi:hypothetical protein
MAEQPNKTVGVVGLFDSADALIRAAAQVRDSGCKKWDCHTPYPVHGLDRAMGMKESAIPYVTLGAGFVGLVVAISLTGGLSALHYPIRVGGKALFSWQAFVPIYFELFVLFAALATMGSVIFFCRLGRWHSPLHDSGVMREITCDRFAIVIESEDENRSADHLQGILEKTGCRDIRPLVEFEEEGGLI